MGMNIPRSDESITYVTTHLQHWLALPTVRARCRYLETHADILAPGNEFILQKLLQEETKREKKRLYHQALLLLRDVCVREQSSQAISEAYVDIFGGFALDGPTWLEEVELQLTSVRQVGQESLTAQTRVDLLQVAIQRAQSEANIAPEVLATMFQELAVAWLEHPRVDRSQALEASLALCEESLRIYTPTKYLYQYAETRYVQGRVYRNRVKGERRENLEQAITCHQEALRVYTPETFPLEYAQTQDSLGIAYQQRIEGERRENLEQAITCHQEALRVYTPETFPLEYARTQSALGQAYKDRIEGERRENLERAITCFRDALQKGILETFPYDYARLQHNLGNVYWIRIEGERRENLEKAILFYQEALRVRTLDAFPYDYAATTVNLGIVYQQRIEGERRENMEKAIACYQEALHVFTLKAFPMEYAQTQNNLGVVYWSRINGERRENLEVTITCLQEALRIKTFQAFPSDYAMTQTNLGIVYRDRIKGERRENLEKSISCFREALRVRTLEAFPREHRIVQLGIAESAAELQDWHSVHVAYQAAVEAEDLLIALGAGIIGRDAVLREGGDASIRDGYALVQLKRIIDAIVTIESGRARGLAEAIVLDAADPSLIGDSSRRLRYTTARRDLVSAQALLHRPLSLQLDEDERRQLELEQIKTYRQVKALFDACVTDIREANDPADFLNDSLDATTLLNVIKGLGPEHAVVYLVATPWGGTAAAAFSSNHNASTHCDALDLPDLTEKRIQTLMELRLQKGRGTIIGGFASAQLGEGFTRLLEDWQGETIQERAKALHKACQQAKQQSTLDIAIRLAMRHRPFARLCKRPIVSLSREEYKLIENTLAQLYLEQELHRCLNEIAVLSLQPLLEWVRTQGATSMTLIPCGYLAAFPLATVLLSNGQAVGEIVPTSIAPSARSLLRATRTSPPRSSVYAIGDPRGDLSWSAAEAYTITSLARQHNLRALARVREHATYDAFVSALQSGLIVDASCHGRFDPHNFLRSALHLAQHNSITMADILSSQADLHGLRLLLLSACQTAILDLQGAREEVHSLAAAMLQAGAQAVLAVQWAVDDEATYLLIVRFVQEWLPRMNQEPPALALARAQLWLRTVTNTDLRSWSVKLPRLPDGKYPTFGTFSGTSKRKSSTRQAPKRWRPVATRGYAARYSEEDAQILVRLRAERREPNACPYSDPFYWAGFQVIGW
jgi:CHAT domain-containing protein/tetratricopeptide (TPR) repeat protein